MICKLENYLNSLKILGIFGFYIISAFFDSFQNFLEEQRMKTRYDKSFEK
jgi:hypothetical protein